MASRSCMNVACGTSESNEWKKGWALRSGDFATLCDKCGYSYEQSSFCDVFHLTDSGWRECTVCGKRLHCGCIASRFMMELLDSGGVNCINCAKNSVLHSIGTDEKCNGTSKIDNVDELQLQSAEYSQLNGSVDKMTLMQLGNHTDHNELRHFLHSQDNGRSGSEKMKQEEVYPSLGETVRVPSSDFRRVADGSCEAAREDICKEHTRTKDMNESLAQTSLCMNLGSRSSTAFGGVAMDGSEHSKACSPFQQGPRSRLILPKHPRSVLATGLEANANMVSQIRVARPPAEGRGRNQLLPRYWPRITEQELQQISGSSNSTVVPLFEKMLSASDAGRIGRLVLPKACAEAYFPPISQPEGLPIRIQDVKGKEWVFQFRFWPNNNSRMYVLEGVTPCIQSMRLQAGDTVTFSRMDPEGKLIMGFRKASNSAGMQDTHPSAIPNGGYSSETFFPGVFENLPIISGCSGLLHSLKGSTDPHLTALSKHFNSGSEDISWLKAETHDDGKKEGLLLPPAFVPERKRARNIGSKSKRLLIDSQDALELKLTWEEAQDLLRPPPSVKPNTAIVENHEFEEYDEPPVFGKKSIFVACSTGVIEQWSQCDSCSKWRRLPVDVLLSSKWTCAENIWDERRNSCSAADELNPRELEDLLRLHKEFKRQRILNSHKGIQDQESSGLDALANAAVLNVSDPAVTATVATTTKHPRHRPGCSCIVCIQPPSGKGKHKPTCTCTVCMTVKRRFKTLMMRKKKRQSEREAEIAQRNQHKWGPADETEVDASSRHESPNLDTSETEARSANELESSKIQINLGENSKGHLDLNFCPHQEELRVGSPNGISMMSLVQVASLPLETYLKQNGLSSLISEPEASPATHLLPAVDNECEGPGMPDDDDDGNVVSAVQEQESGGDGHCEPDQSQNQS